MNTPAHLPVLVLLAALSALRADAFGSNFNDLGGRFGGGLGGGGFRFRR